MSMTREKIIAAQTEASRFIKAGNAALSQLNAESEGRDEWNAERYAAGIDEPTPPPEPSDSPPKGRPPHPSPSSAEPCVRTATIGPKVKKPARHARTPTDKPKPNTAKGQATDETHPQLDRASCVRAGQE